MSIRERIQSPGVVLYTTVFMVTQITGLLLSRAGTGRGGQSCFNPRFRPSGVGKSSTVA
jgi:hypothetical protein